MKEIIRCGDCKYLQYVGQGHPYECRRHVFLTVNPNEDYCSRAEKRLTCPKCGKNVSKGMNYCSYCGQKLEVEE